MDVEPVDTAVRDRYVPGYEPRVHWPAGLLVAYQDRLPHRREAFLLGGTAIAVVVGSAAAANPTVRFLVAMAPLLVRGGIAALLDLVQLGRRSGIPASGRCRPKPIQPFWGRRMS